ncbi:glycosyltransferase [Rhodopseudomonas palustris]|uniref:Glycosyltransferase n=1 Tax=Rhodopseudomonas palustris TaxID=1076 RepID=A0AAX3DVZ1_RHOPL|nr:glycosyltransferase [Rhodopseudomonas palustris]UYO38943.1 glycosyltransferase [Rhodopseudomonas palustris]
MRDGVPPEQPKVSVIMPVRDGERWVAEAIRSVQNQTLHDFELLVIDDGSADATPAILADAAAADPRIVVLTQHRDGLVAGLNSGLSAARAPLIARLDADDIALPDRLARQVDYMVAHPDVVLLGGWATIIDENGQPKGREMRPSPNDLRATLMKKSPFIHPTVMLRAEAARRVGGYHAAFEAGEDYDFWLRLADIGELAILPELLIRYREHSSSVTRTRQLRQIYSARLAKLAAAGRRAGQPDPSATLTTPPDWHDPSPGPFERDSSRLFRMLELADPATAARIPSPAIDLEAIASQLGTLTAGERKFAQAALLNLLRLPHGVPGISRLKLYWLLFALGPLRAVKLLIAK